MSEISLINRGSYGKEIIDYLTGLGHTIKSTNQLEFFDIILVEDEKGIIKAILEQLLKIDDEKKICICICYADIKWFIENCYYKPKLITLDFLLEPNINQEELGNNWKTDPDDSMYFTQRSKLLCEFINKISEWSSTFILGLSQYAYDDNWSSVYTELVKNGHHPYDKAKLGEDTFNNTLSVLLAEDNVKVTDITDDEIERRTKDIIGDNPKIYEIRKQIVQFANYDTKICIFGESGVGKELVARLLHNNSNRTKLVCVNCASIPKNIIESELFGYEEGAFTGAKKKGKLGYFSQANNGTIFLDELNELPIEAQAKLKRVISEGTFQKVGSEGKETRVNVRIIAATNKNLWDEVKNGKFLEDLLFRFNLCVDFTIPPLRVRKDDIPMLIQHLFNLYKKKNPDIITIEHIDKEVCEYIKNVNYSWPGNVRELENIVEYLTINYTDVNTIKLSEEVKQYINGALNTDPTTPNPPQENGKILTSIMQDKLDKFELSLKICKIFHGEIIFNYNKKLYEMMTRYSLCSIKENKVYNKNDQLVSKSDVIKLYDIRQKIYLNYPVEKVEDVDPQGFKNDYGISKSVPQQYPFKSTDKFPSNFNLYHDDYKDKWPLLRQHWIKMQ